MDLDDLFSKLQSDDEALVLLSILGFEAKDWPTLAKLASMRLLLISPLIKEALGKLIEAQPVLLPILKQLRELLDGFYTQGGSLITIINASESRLFKVPKAPLLFFQRFNQSVAAQVPAVAIVGSRSASDLGLKQSYELAYSLAAQGINVISGGAVGIDSAAHRGALKGQGTTVIVSGVSCSLKSDDISEKMREKSEHCAIIYPFGPLVPQGKYMFVERNRFVAALADVLVVVQGQAGSGTLHTVRDAKKLGLPIFAIPGALNDPLAAVPNGLIAAGEARALLDLRNDFSNLLPKIKAPKALRTAPRALIKADALSAQHGDKPELITLLRESGGSLSMPEIIAKTKKNFLELQKELLTYELKGYLVKQGPQFVLTDN